MFRARSALRGALACALVVIVASGVPGVAVAHPGEPRPSARLTQIARSRHIRLSDVASATQTVATSATGALGRSADQRTIAAPASPYADPTPGTTSGAPLQSSTSFETQLPVFCATGPCDGAVSIAASSTEEVQVTDVNVAVFDRLGDVLGVSMLFDFFSGDMTLPVDHGRIAWDALHGRWIGTATGTNCSTNEGNMFLAVSDTADPMGGWLVWNWTFGTGYTPTHASIGFSTDKIGVGLEVDAISGSSTSCAPSTAAWTDGLVLDSANVYSGSNTVHTHWLGDIGWPTVPPFVRGLSAGNDMFAVGGGSFARITGTVAQNNVTISPLASLPGSASALPERPESAYWQNGELWVAATQTCTPTGSVTPTSCARLLGFTTASTPQKLQDIALGTTGAVVTGTQVAIAGDGSVALAWGDTVTSNGVSANHAWATYRTPTDPSNTMRPPVQIAGDQATFTGPGAGYAGIAPDSRDPRGFWAGGPWKDLEANGRSLMCQLQEAGPLRLGGADRFGTADLISSNTFAPGVDVAYIATAFNFPDALAGAAAAGKAKGPILLVPPDGTLDVGTKRELARLQPKSIVILGSNAVVSNAVVGMLFAFSSNIRRAAGSDRFETAAQISADTFAPGVDVAYIAYAFNFPDALAGAAAAGTTNGPILLASTTGTLNGATAAELRRLAPKKIVVLGSTGVIATDVFNQLKAYSSNVVRYSGSDRYGTAVAISQNTFTPGVDRVYVAYSMNFPDALAGAAAAGTLRGPILLAPTTGSIDPGTLAEIQRLAPKEIVVLGSAGVVSDQILRQLLPYTVH